MRKSLIVNILAAGALTLAASSAAQARFNLARVDLSTGIVFPSDNSAIFENAGALPSSAPAFEGLAASSAGGGGISGEASFATSTASAGFGAGSWYLQNETPVLFAGAGFGSRRLGFGMTGYYNLSTESFDADIAMQFGGKAGFAGALALRSAIGGIDSIAGGIGMRSFRGFQLELDAEYYLGSGDLALDPAVAFQLGNRLSLGVGYRFMVIPADLVAGTVRAGMLFWLTPNLGAELLYNHRPATYAAGIKLSM